MLESNPCLKSAQQQASQQNSLAIYNLFVQRRASVYNRWLNLHFVRVNERFQLGFRALKVEEIYKIANDALSLHSQEMLYHYIVSSALRSNYDLAFNSEL